MGLDITKKVDINKIENKWIAYIIPHVEFETTKGTHATALEKDGDKIKVYLNEVVWDKGTPEQLAEAIKHELGHIMFGHCAHMSTLQDNKDKMLWNLCGDCSVHYNVADPNIITEGLKLWDSNTKGVYTYNVFDIPVIPPKILFNILKKKMQNQQQVEQSGLGKCEFGMGDGDVMDWLIVGHELGQALDKARGDGVVVPASLRERHAGIEPGSGRVVTVSTVSTKEWIQKLISMLAKDIPFGRTPSYRREPHNEVGRSLLRRGNATTYTECSILAAIDCSGSINQDDLGKVIKAIMDLTIQYKIQGSVVVFDTTVSKRIPIKDFKSIQQVATTKGGGTKFQPVLDIVNPNETVVFFTDTYLFENSLRDKGLKTPICVTQTPKDSIPQPVKKWRILITNE